MSNNIKAHTKDKGLIWHYRYYIRGLVSLRYHHPQASTTKEEKPAKASLVSSTSPSVILNTASEGNEVLRSHTTQHNTTHESYILSFIDTIEGPTQRVEKKLLEPSPHQQQGLRIESAARTENIGGSKKRLFYVPVNSFRNNADGTRQYK
jgi:hypothetical protein